jgi:hypothetical protein
MSLDPISIKILTGSMVTGRSHFKPVRAHAQGIEITSIHGYRSALPIVGRNQRYKIFDTEITGSISDKPYFTDVESSSDAGLGQDIYQVYTGTLYHNPGWVLNGLINTDHTTSTQVNSQRDMLINTGLTGAALEAALKGRIRTILEQVRSEWELGKAYVNGTLNEEVYYTAGTFSAITKANVKFPDGRIKQVISFDLQSEDYGYGKEYIDSVPYFDLAKYHAETYVRESGPTGMFPIVGSYLSYDEKLSFNGIVEPFAIRRRALGLSIFLEDDKQPGTVWAETTIIPNHSYDSRENDIRAEFFEDAHVKGFARYNDPLDQAQALLEPEFVSSYNKNQYPFKERSNADLLISDSEIESIQLSMDPTLDEGLLPVTHVDMTTGFDAESRDRINSIVYRGMKRR